MAKTYVSDISHYLNDIGLLKPDMPTPINRMAEFLLAIVEAVTPKCPTIGRNTGIRSDRHSPSLAVWFARGYATRSRNFVME